MRSRPIKKIPKTCLALPPDFRMTARRGKLEVRLFLCAKVSERTAYEAADGT